jgi:hypothetical protein
VKLQIPTSNIQKSTKIPRTNISSQILKIFERKKPASVFVTARAGASNLEFVWNLAVGIWNFPCPSAFGFLSAFGLRISDFAGCPTTNS